jgi:hypothetical protein
MHRAALNALLAIVMTLSSADRFSLSIERKSDGKESVAAVQHHDAVLIGRTRISSEVRIVRSTCHGLKWQLQSGILHTAGRPEGIADAILHSASPTLNSLSIKLQV